jgi:hypothetical protein
MMIKTLQQAIHDTLDDNRTTYVFPSEIAAASWLSRTLVESGRRAMPSRRFMGWDAFKSMVFPGDANTRPSTKVIRGIFAKALLTENAKAAFLQALPPPDQAALSPRFAAMIARALPALRHVPDGQGKRLADWRTIRDRYARFMSDQNLHEPAWLIRLPENTGTAFILAFPDLTEDWIDYEAAVTAMPETRIIRSALPRSARTTQDGQVAAANGPAAARFHTVVDEVRAVLLKIHRAVDEGIDPATILISVAAPESTLPILEREAAVAGIVLDVREGAPLSDSAGGRLLSDILAVTSSRRSFESLRRLLLDQSRPWQQPDLPRALIDFGIARHVIAPIPDSPIDTWTLSMRKATPARLVDFYRVLTRLCDRVAKAGNFEGLRKAFADFKSTLLVDSAWDQRSNDELARCIAEMEELHESAQVAGMAAIPDAAATCLDHLESVRYLPVSTHHGIPVYRFPAAAGAMPAMHFVINLTEKSAVAAARPLGFLRDDERQRAGVSDHDLSAGLITLLAESGDKVLMSWSEEGPGGTNAPHPAIHSVPPAAIAMSYQRSAWLPNLDCDFSQAANLRTGFPGQRASAAAALRTTLRGNGPYFDTGHPGHPVTLAADIRDRIADRLKDADGRLLLSDTAMEGYRDCPFKRIHESYLKITAMPTGLSFLDARLIGSIYHDAFSRCFRPLVESGHLVAATMVAGTASSPSDADAVLALDSAILSESSRQGPFATILLDMVAPRLRAHFLRAMQTARQLLDGWQALLVEPADMTAPTAMTDVVYRGRPDLVCITGLPVQAGQPGQPVQAGQPGQPVQAGQPGQPVQAGQPGQLGQDRIQGAGYPPATILDYKKSRVPAATDLTVDQDGNLLRLQLPLYAALVADAGYRPVTAAYLAIEKEDGATLRYAFGKDQADTVETIKHQWAALEKVAARTVATIRQGLVWLPAASDQERLCGACELRPVCRVRYTVR